MTKVTAFIQARFNSSRLPGKVLKTVQGKSLLEHQIIRILSAKSLDQVVIVTATDPDNDPIEKICADINVPCFRGSLDDVLDRFYQASLLYPSDHYVRLTADCPVIDPDIIDLVVNMHLEKGADYSSSGVSDATLPDGLDVEIMTAALLSEMHKKASKQSEREHVTLYVRNHPDAYNIVDYSHSENLSDLRWTVDEPEDFILIERIYDALYPQKNDFKMADILAFLEKQPELKTINKKFERNEGLAKSIKQDEES